MLNNIEDWNIIGAHSDVKLNQCKSIINTHSLSLLAIFETKLNSSLSLRATNFINPAWQMLNNLEEAPFGRIPILFNPAVFYPFPYHF